MLSEAFIRYRDRECLYADKHSLTYSQVLTLGRGIIGELPRQRSLVVLQCSLTVESVAAYVALVVDGHVPLLLERSLAPELADPIIQSYRPDAVIDPEIGRAIVSNSLPTDLHKDLGLLLSTSGSTGSAKLVRLSSAGQRSNAEAIGQYLEITSDERALLNLPMSYSYGLSIIHSHFIAGATVCLTRSSVMEASYWDALADGGATSVAGVPFFYTTLRRFGEERLNATKLKTLTQAGGRLDPKVAAWFGDWAERNGRKFVVMYGQTEAGPRIAHLPSPLAASAPDAIGIAIPGVDISLVDETGAAVPDGSPGELRVHSPAVMMGYARTAADLSLDDELQGVLLTGDIATRGSDGLLRISGRRSRMLKIYGLRLNLDEVESQLAAEDHAAWCFGQDDQLRVLTDRLVDPVAVRSLIVARFSLPPRGIEVRALHGELDRLPTGKISAAALADAWQAAEAIA